MAAAAAAAAHNAASGWASRLHPDLIPQIGWRVLAGDLLGYVRFRAVCALWRSTTINPRGRGLVDPRFYPRRWLLLPEGHDICPGHSSLLGYVRFFNLSTGIFVRAWLPIFQDHYILDIVDGLVLLLEEQNSTVRLLNPFTGDTADLPPLAAPTNLSLGSRYLICFREISATTVTVSPDGLITVMILLPSEHHVAFATSGGSDREWSYSSWTLSSIQSSVSFQSRIYILSTEYNNDPQIFEIDPPWPDEEVGSAGVSSLSPPRFVATCPCKTQPPYYLVECDSDILVIGFCDKQNSSQMLVYRLSDMILDMPKPLTSIGGHVIFPNIDSSLSVSGGALPTIEGDTIVKYMPGTKHLGKYNIQSSTWFPPTDDDTPELSSGGLIHSIFWHYYDYNGPKCFLGTHGNNASPRLVKQNWRDERSSGSAPVDS